MHRINTLYREESFCLGVEKAVGRMPHTPHKVPSVFLMCAIQPQHGGEGKRGVQRGRARGGVSGMA